MKKNFPVFLFLALLLLAFALGLALALWPAESEAEPSEPFALLTGARSPEPPEAASESKAVFDPAVYGPAHALTFHTDLSRYNDRVIQDKRYDTRLALSDDVMSITLTADEPIGGLYIEWDSAPGPWTLLADGAESEHGENGYLHEYVFLESSASSITIVLPESRPGIAEASLYSPGLPPEGVQLWEQPCEQADLLVVSTHADDEFIFFGGLIPYYAAVEGKEVQVVYMTTHANNHDRYRVHEQLNGLWAAYVRHYPVVHSENDRKYETLAETERKFDTEAYLGFQVEMLRRFRPSVAVVQDENGEYGHPAHKLAARCMEQAVVLAADASAYPQSATAYGTWDTPKLYLHLYGDKAEQTVLDFETPSEALAGRTPYEVAVDAFSCHKSQQKWGFAIYPSGHRYDCHRYGLYRSLVGEDGAKDDLFEHIEA